MRPTACYPVRRRAAWWRASAVCSPVRQQKQRLRRRWKTSGARHGADMCVTLVRSKHPCVCLSCAVLCQACSCQVSLSAGAVLAVCYQVSLSAAVQVAACAGCQVRLSSGAVLAVCYQVRLSSAVQVAACAGCQVRLRIQGGAGPPASLIRRRSGAWSRAAAFFRFV